MTKNMATCSESRKKRARTGFRYQMELNFDSEDAKQAFLTRIESAKCRLAPRGSRPLDSRELLHLLLDEVEATPTPQADCLEITGDQRHNQTIPMLDNSGLLVLQVSCHEGS